MKENLDYIFAFDTFLKAWNDDKVSTEIFLKAKDSASLKISNLVVNRPIQFGDKEYNSLSVNDLMEVLADNKDFKNYCDAIVQDTRGRILIVQRTNNDGFQPSTWALPGGKAEQGEFLRDAVKRELVEETNLKSSHCNYSTLYKNEDGSFSHYFWCYVENCADIILEADELQRYAWIDSNELDKYDFMLDLKDRIKSIFNIPFKGKYLTEQELTALAQVDIKKGKAASIGEVRVWDGVKVQKQADGEWKEIKENKDKQTQEKIASFLEDQNFIVRTVDSKTSFGNSYYIYVYSDKEGFENNEYSKIRISDHGVSNLDRVFNEIHYRDQSFNSILDTVNFQLRRNSNFYKKEIEVEEKGHNVQTRKIEESDIITKEWTSKKSKEKMYEVTRTYKNKKMAWFKNGESEKPYVVLEDPRPSFQSQFLRKAYTETSIETSYEKGCLMLDTNWVSREGNNRWDEILMMINPDDVYNEPGFGKEYSPHITVLYGFELDRVNPQQIERLLPEGSISFRICDVSYFESELYDVLKFGIESEQLHELNATYRSLPHQNSYPDYRPHLTIAYLKKGRAERYIPVLKNWVNYAFQSSKFDYSHNDENGKKTKSHWDVKGFSSVEDKLEDKILKAQKYQIGQISQATGLKKVAPGKWVDPKTGKEVKVDENGSPRAGKVKPSDISSHSDEDLSEYAKNSSESDLQAVIKESNEPRLREAAHKELERRGKEEKPQEEGNKKEEKKDEPKESKKAEIHPEIKEKSKEIVEKLESFKGDEDLNQEDLNEVIDLLKSGDIDNAFKKMKDSEISYSLPTSYENLKKLSIDFEIDKKFGLDFATKPGKYDVFRAGDVSDQKNGVFFSITEGGASAYSDGGKRPVKKYTIDIKNPLVSKRAEDAYSLLSGKPKQEILKERDRAKSVQKWWVDLDTKVAALAKKKGYDAITYTSPAPPAIREVISLDKKNVEEKDKKE